MNDFHRGGHEAQLVLRGRARRRAPDGVRGRRTAARAEGRGFRGRLGRGAPCRARLSGGLRLAAVGAVPGLPGGRRHDVLPFRGHAAARRRTRLGRSALPPVLRCGPGRLDPFGAHGAPRMGIIPTRSSRPVAATQRRLLQLGTTTRARSLVFARARRVSGSSPGMSPTAGGCSAAATAAAPAAAPRRSRALKEPARQPYRRAAFGRGRGTSPSSTTSAPAARRRPSKNSQRRGRTPATRGMATTAGRVKKDGRSCGRAVATIPTISVERLCAGTSDPARVPIRSNGGRCHERDVPSSTSAPATALAQSPAPRARRDAAARDRCGSGAARTATARLTGWVTPPRATRGGRGRRFAGYPARYHRRSGYQSRSQLRCGG